MLLKTVEELNMSLWEDLWKIAVVDIDWDTLQAVQLWFRVRADNLEFDDLCGIGDNHADVNSSGTVVLQAWRLRLIALVA